MNRGVSRRGFVAAAAAGAAGGTAALAMPSFLAAGEAPQALVRRGGGGAAAAKPIVISAENGNKSKDADGQTCVAKAFKMIADGSDVLDALIAGVNIVELDPEETSVGYGGLPNADGVVQLDASVMHGPLRRAGAVACLEGVRTPSRVARAVMDMTDNHLLVGRDAQRFARDVGFKIEDDLNTAKSRKLWLEWKRRVDPEHWIDPKRREQAARRATLDMAAAGLIDPNHVYGTINCNGMNAKGEVCGVTTTSGLAFKIPGRVGDSPILGAGLYVDNAVGAAGSTGRGEANLFNCCSFLIIELLRAGAAPKDAGIAALKRVAANTIERRLLNARGKPNFQLTFYILSAATGDHACVTMYESNGGKAPVQYALCNEDGPQTRTAEALYPGTPEK